ncbi:Rne/Rng family ribonuclease [bacterium]|nr:Rne/Rng family ribonuclease [bacterium]
MYKEILISIDEREGRAIVLEDGRAVEILIAREERQVGSIFKGRVADVLPGMNAAFVDIGLERNAFLCANDAIAGMPEGDHFTKPAIADIVKVNQETLVQVLKEAIDAKGARITSYITLPGRYLVLLPSAQYVGVSRRIPEDGERERLRRIADGLRPEGMGIIVRTAAEGHDEDELKRDLEYLLKVWHKVQEKAEKCHAPYLVYQELDLVDKILRDIFTEEVDRLVIDNRAEYQNIYDRLEHTAPSLLSKIHLYTDARPLFDMYGVEQEIDNALSRRVWLASGGYLIIDRTEALWVLDINTGKFTGRHSLAETILKTNLEACKEICRQLRLRDMAGIIIVDFIDMDSSDDQRKVLEVLGEELKKDRTRTNLVSMTELGLVQITRKREGKDLDGIMRDVCPICHGRGKVLSPKSVALRARRNVLREMTSCRREAAIVTLSPEAAYQFIGKKSEEVKLIAEETQATIRVVPSDSIHPERFSVICGESAILRNKPLLSNGQQARTVILENNGGREGSALAIISGNLVEVSSAAERIGKEVVVRIVEAGPYISRGELVR